MEGNLQIHPGDPLRVGFDFTMPGSHPVATISIYNASVSVLVKCTNGSTPALAIMLPAQTITDTAGNSGWYPSGDQSSSLVYQGALTAPDLCGGGVMNDASGAVFNATFFSTDTIDTVNFRFHYGDNTSGSWSATVKGTPTPFAKTVTSASLTPALSLSLAGDHSTGIPGDTITYTATVMNTGSTLALAGDLVASDTGTATATVKSYWDTLYTSLDGSSWTPLAGAAATQTGYTPAVPAPASSGMTLTPTSVPATGVTYPTTGDRILATSIAAGKTATWHYTASIPLTPSQVANLLDPTKVKKIRNSFHLEVSPANPNVTQPAIVNVDYSALFFGAAPSASVANVLVTIQPPASAAPMQFNATNTPALTSLAPGASVPVSGTFTVPVAAAKASGQSDAAYVAALLALEGNALKASATASGTTPSGNISAAAPPQVTTMEHLPIVSIAKSGPSTIAAGTNETNPLSLSNNGGAVASGLVVTDVVPSGSAGTVTGVPVTLAPAATASASASFPVPTGQPAGSLTDTAALTWQDANSNVYGPVSSSFTTTVSNNLAGASLTLSPATAGPDVVGTSQTFTAVLLDHNGSAIDNQAVILSITGANPTTQAATTNPSGSVNFSYGGANRGTDQVQASVISGALTLQSNTVSVSWITPIRAVSTTLVNATVYHGSCCGFSATPASTPVFTIQVPTINFNPPAGTIPHNPTGVGVFSRPMTDVTTDVAGNYTGAITLQGVDASNVLHQAGSGDLFEFDMVLTGNFTIAQSGSLTYNFFSDDGFIFGIKGATRISGPLVNPPASMLTPFNGYPVLGAYDQPTAPVANNMTVSFPSPGVYPYEIDYNECCSGQLALTVATGGSGLPPTGNISLTPFNILAATVGQTQTLHVSVMDASGVAISNQPIIVTITGANPQLLPGVTDSTGLATLTYQAANPGQDTLQVSSQVSGVPELSNIVTVTWNPAPPAPNISAPSPLDGSLVEKPVSIKASISPPTGQTIASWQVTLQALDPGPVITLNSGTGTPPATLATLDPTLLPNDTYNISVSATASGGGVQTVSTTVVVFGSLKPGRYQTTYQDLSVPVNGFPMEIRRTYDSIDKSPGDFGVGWRVSVANFRTAPNRALGAAGWTQYNLSCGLGLCLTAFKNSAPRFVSVTFPDQHTEVFDFVPSGGTNIFFGGAAVFRARAGTGTTSTLEVAGDASLNYTGDGNLYGSSGSLFNPQRFKLTTLDGTALILDTQVGLVSETDRNTNSLNIDASGIHSSSGQSVTYVRDGSGRITQITGPSGQTLSYTYSAAGDLGTSTDPNGNQTIYTYDSSHDLLRAVGGSQPLQTLNYDPSGRLVAIADAMGNTTTVSNDIPGQKQTVTDPLGRMTTVYTFDDLGDVLRIDRVSGGQTLTTTATYESAGLALTRTNPLSHVWTGSYDANGDLLSVRPPSGNGLSLTYDNFGFPLSATDVLGNHTTMAYDTTGNLASITNALGETQRFAYDRLGNRTHLTDALGKTWDYTYDSAGHTTSITDPQGHGIGFAYDASGRMTSAGDALGRVTTYTYDAMGHPASATDALGGSTSYTYNPQGQMASRTDALGKVTTYVYDSNKQLTSVTDPLGHVTAYSYDADGRMVGQIDAAGGTTTYTYDGFGRLASEADPLGRTTSYTYDASGKLATRTRPNGGKFAYAYDNDGRQVSLTDPLGRVTTSAYDPDGRQISSTDPTGAVTRYSVDGLGRTVSSTDPPGHTTTNAYDAAGNLTSVKDALGETTTYSYDGAGNKIAVTDPLGNITNYGYDSNNRPVAVVDPLGRTTHSTYDLVGRLSSVSLQTGSTTAYTYDALGRPIAITDHLGNSTTFTYDAAGRKTSSTDPKGNITRFGYDAVGRQVSITDAAGGVVHVTYDAAGHQATVSNPRGDTTTLTYDALGNLATQTTPSGGSTSNSYDAAGQLVSQTDPRGIRLSFTYDVAGRLTGTAYPNGSLAFGYDTAGRRTSMVDPTGTTTYAYDNVGRLTSVAAPGGAVGYTYDAAGRRTSLSQPVRGSITYGYDAASQLVSLKDWVGRAFTFVYTPDGLPLQITSPEQVTTTYGYDSAGRLTAVHHDGPSGGAHFDYTLDANGNRASVSTAAGTETYTYDALNRLVGVVYPNADTATYTYDSAGNQLTKRFNGTTTSYVYDSSGRLISAGGTTFTYDAAGNLTSAGSSGFTWDWADRLTSALVGGTNSTYTYDGDGYRVAAQDGTSTNSYLWDRAASLPTLVDDGSQGYVQASQGVLEQSGSGTGSQTFPLADGLGSIRNVADASGAFAGTASYDAFGTVRSRTGSSGIFGFGGQQTDPTGLSFLRARYYDPTVGRFLSADSVQPNAQGTQGYNLYSYVADNPATNVDPTGHLYFENLAITRTVVLLSGFLAFTLVFKAQLTASLAVLLNALAPTVEQTAAEVSQWADDVVKELEKDLKPKPKPCTQSQWCVPIPIKPTPTPRERCSAGAEAVPGLISRAESIRAVEANTPARIRAVADLRVRKFDDQSCLDIVGAGADDLTPRQRTAVGELGNPSAVAVKLYDRHAEVTVLTRAQQYGTPLALGVTFNICTVESVHSDTCRLEIAAAGGVITPDQHGAYWPGNQ